MVSQSRQWQSEINVPLNPNQPVLSVAPLNSAPYIGPPIPVRTSSSPNVSQNKIMIQASPEITIPSNSSGMKMGPSVGLVDIGLCEDSYFFRVSLPGVARDEHFSCVVLPCGKVLVKGVTITGAKVICRNKQVFRMLTQNLCPPGHFTISFQLPGPVDEQSFSGDFRNDGILEGRVKKK